MIIVPDGNVRYYFSTFLAGFISALPGIYPHPWKLLIDKLSPQYCQEHKRLLCRDQEIHNKKSGWKYSSPVKIMHASLWAHSQECLWATLAVAISGPGQRAVGKSAQTLHTNCRMSLEEAVLQGCFYAAHPFPPAPAYPNSQNSGPRVLLCLGLGFPRCLFVMDQPGKACS